MFLQMLHNMLQDFPQLKVVATARTAAGGVAAVQMAHLRPAVLREARSEFRRARPRRI